MNAPILNGFMNEMEKIASFKKNLPWALSRGLTGAGSTVVIGLTMSKVLKDLKKKQKEAKGIKGQAKAVMPLAAVGGGIGIGKGFAEKSLERTFKKMLRLK